MFGRLRSAPSLIAVTLLAASILVWSPTASARIGDVYDSTDRVDVRECGALGNAGAFAYVQIRYANQPWVNKGKSTVPKNGCINTFVFPADLAPSGVGQIAVRVFVPRQKVKGVWRNGWKSKETGYRVWPTSSSSRDVFPHLDAFAAKYGVSVATIICSNPNGSSQGTGVSIPITLSEKARTDLPGASSLLATAGHVVDPCFARNSNLTVLYQGKTYPARAWNYSADPDLGSVISTAPIPAAAMAIGPGKRPVIGDTAVAIGTATGVVSTTTQGTVNGVSDTELNTTVPSGHGASGGPMFNNKGEVVGLVVAGNGSLTVATALPAFCGRVYASAWCALPTWP
jgi:hypothetical protein